MRRRRWFQALLFLLLTVVIIQLALYWWSPLHSAKETAKIILTSKPTVLATTKPTPPQCIQDIAVLKTSLSELYTQMGDDIHWSWIRERLTRLWPEWTTALEAIKHMLQPRRKKLRIVVVPGILLGTNYAKNESIQAGGPLGDLVQWADLIAGLHILGHNVTLKKEFFEVARGLRYDRFYWSSSPNCPQKDVDLVFADIISMKTFPDDVIKNHRCKFRVLDAYGTEAMYNDQVFSKRYSYHSNYGELGLHLKQFYTFYPHTPDNSFLGFVVRRPSNSPGNKENIGLLYGKDPNYFTDSHAYIKVLMQFMTIYATVRNATTLPSGVKNHGVVTASEYRRLLAKAKFFIGVGLPMESTGVMEALAQGCIFLNPMFQKSQQDILQKEGKPTSRKMTSQVPYLEQYVGPPQVYTLNTTDTTQVESIIQQAKLQKQKQFIPREFTMEGFLERLSVYIWKQDFCVGTEIWPPLSSMVIRKGVEKQSCVDVCREKDLICEPVFFQKLNVTETFKKLNLPCRNFTKGDHTTFPGFFAERHMCIFQRNLDLYSCASGHTQVQRICPCRDYIKHQMAWCKGCV